MIISISKGQQITIPAEMRSDLGLNVGSKMEIVRIGNKIVLTSLGEDLESIFAKAKKIKPKHNLSPKTNG